MKIVILGGGTAGWSTALFAKSVFPLGEVTLIQSKKIGIIGVGEATTPSYVNFLRDIDIDPFDVIKATNGSVKNGIFFENWNGDGKKYFHPFGEDIANFQVKNVINCNAEEFYFKRLLQEHKDISEYRYLPTLSYSNKVDTDNTNWSLHFDANNLADYLEKVGIQRGINIIEGKYERAILDDIGKITKLCLDYDREVECDFVFDCSGFARLIIGGLYKQKWISYANNLPMKKAIPFWLDSEEEVRPYTGAIAMKYGWMWNIPLQHRIGSGYIFDSDYIDENQALSEAEEYYGRKLEIRKIISFDPGRLENFWVKNCMAVGLSSSFLEPLESTSLMVSVDQLKIFRQFLNEIKDNNEASADMFNGIMSSMVDTMKNFIYLHYLTKRNDSEFWKNFKENHPIPDSLAPLFTKIKSSTIRRYDLPNTLAGFSLISYIQVCSGLELFEKKFDVSAFGDISPSPEQYKQIIDTLLPNAMSHRQFLNSLT